MRTYPPVRSVAELRAIEAANGDVPLMERAGRAAAEVARALAGERGGHIVVLAGPGNNGGDAFVVARWLRAWFHDIAVVFPGDAANAAPGCQGGTRRVRRRRRHHAVGA